MPAGSLDAYVETMSRRPPVDRRIICSPPPAALEPVRLWCGQPALGWATTQPAAHYDPRAAFLPEEVIALANAPA